MKRSYLVALGFAALLPAITLAQPANSPATSQSASAPAVAADAHTLPDGLNISTLAAPAPQGAKAGDTLIVGYVGKLMDGTIFDKSEGKPFIFVLGEGSVIKGWDEGMAGMQIGEKRHLVIPAALAYGDRGSPPTIPANATLQFDVECYGIVRPPIPAPPGTPTP